MHTIHYLYPNCKNKYELKLKEIENQMNSFFKRKTIYPVPLINDDMINLNKHKYEITKKMIEDSKKVLSESDIVIKISKERELIMDDLVLSNVVVTGNYGSFNSKKKTNYAKLEFVQLEEDTFMLNNFYNVRGEIEIKKEFGELIFDIYSSKELYLLKQSEDSFDILYNDNVDKNFESYYIGDEFSKKEMEDLIKECKLCGNLFSESYHEAQKNKIITVEI